jgi:hypothetical protein
MSRETSRDWCRRIHKTRRFQTSALSVACLGLSTRILRWYLQKRDDSFLRNVRLHSIQEISHFTSRYVNTAVKISCLNVCKRSVSACLVALTEDTDFGENVVHTTALHSCKGDQGRKWEKDDRMGN